MSTLGKQSEADLQAMIVTYCTMALRDVEVVHIPNGELRSKATAGKLKGMGVRRGAADLLFVMCQGQVVWVECKTVEGRQSPDQKTFEASMRRRGHEYYIVRTFEEFEALAAEWKQRGWAMFDGVVPAAAANRVVYGEQQGWSGLLKGLRDVLRGMQQSLQVYVDPQFYREADAEALRNYSGELNVISSKVGARAQAGRAEREEKRDVMAGTAAHSSP